MLFPAIAAVTGLSIGTALGYLLAYRYKQQYQAARRQLANLRGENYRGEVTTIPLQAPTGVGHGQLPETAELPRWRERCARLEEQLAETQRKLLKNTEDVTELPPETMGATGTEQWQLAQLHREQIAMQLTLDEHQAQVRTLTEQLDSERAAAERNLLELRTILGEHEAMIASLEREKASLVERLKRC